MVVRHFPGNGDNMLDCLAMAVNDFLNAGSYGAMIVDFREFDIIIGSFFNRPNAVSRSMLPF